MNNNYNEQGFFKLAGKVVEEGLKVIFNIDKDVDNINKLTPDEGYRASIDLIKKDGELSLREKLDYLNEVEDRKQDRIERAVQIKRGIVFDKAGTFFNILHRSIGFAALGYSTYLLIKR